jgi:hypothetical protein
MITIAENIEDNVYHYKDWYKAMDKLVGENFDSTTNFENSLQLGQKIHFYVDNPALPTGMSIPANSQMTLDQLGGLTLVVNDISILGNVKTIKLGIRSTDSSD